MASHALASQVSRLKSLEHKHAILSSRIDEEQSHPSSADFYLRQLKKQKLMLKQEMEDIRMRGSAN